MESLLGTTKSNPSKIRSFSDDQKYNSKEINLRIINENISKDNIKLNFKDRSKGLSITVREIIKKLNELLKTSLPAGIESLSPQDTTPDATATRIVQGVTAFFSVYAKQNPRLSGQELLDSFMKTIKSGVQQGYDDAYKILEGLGAFEFDGVRAGVEETKVLIESKLDSFYQMKKEELSDKAA